MNVKWFEREKGRTFDELLVGGNSIQPVEQVSPMMGISVLPVNSVFFRRKSNQIALINNFGNNSSFGPENDQLLPETSAIVIESTVSSAVNKKLPLMPESPIFLVLLSTCFCRNKPGN